MSGYGRGGERTPENITVPPSLPPSLPPSFSSAPTCRAQACGGEFNDGNGGVSDAVHRGDPGGREGER